VTCPDAREQQDRRQQTRNELHVQPQNLSIPNLSALVMQGMISVLPDRGFVQTSMTLPMRFKSSVARGMHLVPSRYQSETAPPFARNFR
jgi:hypothetical protein